LQGDKVKLKVPLVEKESISHDVRRFRFALPTPQHTLGLPLGKHVHVSAEINGEIEVRAYTPVTNTSVQGYFDLVVKVYFKDVHPKFPGGGKMSQYLDALPLGATIDIRGPSGLLLHTSLPSFAQFGRSSARAALCRQCRVCGRWAGQCYGAQKGARHPQGQAHWHDCWGHGHHADDPG
jgi:hypothetical protein